LTISCSATAALATLVVARNVTNKNPRFIVRPLDSADCSGFLGDIAAILLVNSNINFRLLIGFGEQLNVEGFGSKASD
jgi:hypothetical protein